MVNDLKKLMLAAVGTMATVYETVDKNINEMINKGKITVEEGKELSEQLKKDVEVKTTQATNIMINKIEELKPLSKEDVRLMIAEYNIDVEDQVASLKNKIYELECLKERVNELEKLKHKVSELEKEV
ncbi:MAG: phasin family protein [Sarcina sp.]